MEQSDNKQPLKEGNRDRESGPPRERRERMDRPDRPVTSPGEPFRYVGEHAANYPIW